MSMVDSSTGTENNALEMDSKGSRDGSPEILIEVYRHYRELALNEDRLLNERLMVFLTSQSILFLGYITCFQVLPRYLTLSLIMIILPFVGISLCFFGYILANPARTAWEKWQKELKKIENELKEKLIRKRKVDLVFPSDVRCKIETGYLSSWDDVQGKDKEKLLRFLKDDLDIDWATKNAKVSKFDDTKTIRIFTDENSAEIKVDEKTKKAILNIKDVRTYNLEVKTENGKLNIYEPRHFCSGEWPWVVGCCYLPLTFLLLWLFSLCCSLHIIISAS